MISIVQLVLTLLGTLLSGLKANGATQEILKAVEDAIAAVNVVHSTPVTFGQLEGLRADIKWPN